MIEPVKRRLAAPSQQRKKSFAEKRKNATDFTDFTESLQFVIRGVFEEIRN
jgi:hypothetical protein